MVIDGSGGWLSAWEKAGQEGKADEQAGEGGSQGVGWQNRLEARGSIGFGDSSGDRDSVLGEQLA